MPYVADYVRDRGGLHHLGTVDGVTGVVERQFQEAHRVGVRDQPDGAGLLLVRKNVAAGIDERGKVTVPVRSSGTPWSTTHCQNSPGRAIRC